jgi:hypothetical protein
MKERWQGPGGILGKQVDDLRQIPDKHERDVSRRDMLVATGLNAGSLLAASALVGKLAIDESHKKTEPMQESKGTGEIYTQDAKEDDGVPNPEWWKKVWYVTPKALAGKNVDNHLEWSYIAPEPAAANLVNPESLPKILPPIPFHQNLNKMLEVKKDLTRHTPDAAREAAFYDSLEASYTELFESKAIRKMSLKEFRSLIATESTTVLAELREKQSDIVATYLSKYLDGTSWKQGSAERKRYEGALAQCLQSLAERITPNIMLAYITTELMPAPERGTAMLGFLLEHAGVEFIERIPALGDSELSYGPFQLTPYAVGARGSVTNLEKVMHSKLVPDSLDKFTSIEDHVRAGFLFAFHNILTLVQDVCSEGRYDELVTILEGAGTGKMTGNSSVFPEFISAAHHRPASALNAMHVWLAANKKVPQAKRSKSLVSSFAHSEIDQDDKKYAEKARRCLEDVQKV